MAPENDNFLKAQFVCCFPPIHNALQSCRGRDGMEVKFAIPEAQIAVGMRLYLMREKAVAVVVIPTLMEDAYDEGELAEVSPECAALRVDFEAVVSLIQSPGARDGLEAKLWVPECQLPYALPLHQVRGRALRVTIEVLEDELKFADAKTKKRAEREKIELAAVEEISQNSEGAAPSARSTPKRRVRSGRIECGDSGL